MIVTHLYALLPLLVLLVLSLIFYGRGLVHLATCGYAVTLGYVATLNQWEILFFPIVVVSVIIAVLLFFVAMSRGDWL